MDRRDVGRRCECLIFENGWQFRQRFKGGEARENDDRYQHSR